MTYELWQISWKLDNDYYVLLRHIHDKTVEECRILYTKRAFKFMLPWTKFYATAKNPAKRGNVLVPVSI